ncbi:hypothetical protein JZ751_025095 [Albula glossodonta]|uniref:Uncharacterized protein n=1 Tax=Albula glossodonta TaxID=121402 RepID=A0A8T2PFB8_9TELE|nr:hypothetical protein JZ751_025095 [Albula glossodonta]
MAHPFQTDRCRREGGISDGVISVSHCSSATLCDQLDAHNPPLKTQQVGYGVERSSGRHQVFRKRAYLSECGAEAKEGFLIGARPENACEPIDPPPLQDNVTGTFIVLIKRFDCNFDVKKRKGHRVEEKGEVESGREETEGERGKEIAERDETGFHPAHGNVSGQGAGRRSDTAGERSSCTMAATVLPSPSEQSQPRKEILSQMIPYSLICDLQQIRR